ncbi:uncharacterized protein CDAR_534721 [Caerostris darwini]|uniref:DNA-directed DNA polymerase n=1 Tax=Caerostris darwini TaxID=1538125 RepID=A0AAV4UHN6_9ARAC|nr:uncharacterized protein CDAR_534721 [Caerostris darwini]
MDCEEKYKETELPPKEAFYNRLNECDISDKDYKHAQNVWKSFNINNLREYSELYVKTDVLILADIFEKFRDVCLKTYKLDPAWYFTAPGDIIALGFTNEDNRERIRYLCYYCEFMFEMYLKYEYDDTKENFQEMTDLIEKEENEAIKLNALGVLYDIQKIYFAGKGGL